MLKKIILLASLFLLFGFAFQKDSTITKVENFQVQIDFQKRFERLKYGVGFGEIFRYPDEESEKYFTKYINKQDIDLLKKLGIRHVRVAIHPDFIFAKDSLDNLNHTFLGYVDKFIDFMNKNDISVILDIHPQGSSIDYETSSNLRILKKIWIGLAQHYSSSDPDMLFFEILNEPIYEGKEGIWQPIQENILNAIRKKAPYHTIILSGPNGGDLDGLMKLKPLKDKNVVYTFHFYDPFLFTHQGADRIDYFTGLRNVYYPYTSLECLNIVNTFGYQSMAWRTIKWYCENTPSTKEQIKSKIKEALDWSSINNVKLYMGEFGVYTDYTDKESKIRRYEDIKSIIQEMNIGRSVWGYTRCFGLGVIKNSQYNITSYDHDVTKILFNYN